MVAESSIRGPQSTFCAVLTKVLDCLLAHCLCFPSCFSVRKSQTSQCRALSPMCPLA